jgi:hypothetical protein
MRTFVALTILALLSTSAQAEVLCVTNRGALKARLECKPKETQVDPAALGLQGPQGPEGPAGPAGSASAPVVRLGPADTANGGAPYLESTAACNLGEVAISGGFRVIDGCINLQQYDPTPTPHGGSFPSDDLGNPSAAGDTPTAWTVSGLTACGTDNTVQAYALCVAP